MRDINTEKSTMDEKEVIVCQKKNNHRRVSTCELFTFCAGNSLPFGVAKVPEGVQFAVYLPDSKESYLKLYKKGRKLPYCEIALTEKYQVGGVYFVTVQKANDAKDERQVDEILSQDFEYMYEADGEEFIDPYAEYITGRDTWGKRSVRPSRGGICIADFDWREDAPLQIPYADLILYQLHMRGYTKHSSSGVEHKGTFRGLIEKIPYIKELGINGVVLLPVYEFDEIQTLPDERNMAEAIATRDEKFTEKRLNYWGYGTKNTYYFAPKASYASAETSPSLEFKELVRELHANGIEVILDIYFSPGTNLFLMTDCLRNWAMHYHVDGFRVNQEVMPSLTLASDPILSGVKILGNYWDITALHQAGISGRKNALGEYNEAFMYDARRFLKGDEGMVEKVVHRFSRNESAYSVVNFMTHVNGFTMMDLVSYDIKHNEENGEMNRDGAEINYSWNCGVEGKTRKRTILERRMIQIRNAFLMLLTSQGTPMLLAGDEFGNTQMGNNNPYCQDSSITWLNWAETKTSETILTFVKNMIKMRRSYSVLHQEKTIQMMDTLSCGMPDLSTHGVQAWRPDFSNYSRMLGMLYYGAYTAKKDGRSVYIIYNMYWEAKSFDLPNLPKKSDWKIMIDTYDNTFDETLLKEKVRRRKKKLKKDLDKKKRESYIPRKTMVPPRSVVVFVEVPEDM